MNFNSKTNIKKFVTIVMVILLFTGIVLAGIILTPRLLELFKHPERLKQAISNIGFWAPLGMVGLQVIQVIIAPMPGQVVAFLSGYVYGVFKGTILSMIGLTIGSIIVFLLARVTGRRLLKYFLPQTTLRRFDDYTLRQGPFLFFLLLLIPNPIGDGVYYLAGLTNIPLLFYIILVVVSRLPSNIVNNLIGSKASCFGIYEWIIFGIIIIILALIYYLNKKRIEGFFLRIARNQKHNENSF